MAEVESPGLTSREPARPVLSTVEQTYKARDVEGWLDLHFYRPIGFRLARFFAFLRLTPSTVSLLGGGIGIAAGHFYYYPDLRLNLIGMALQIAGNAFDNADGQLARLTNQASLVGAVVDGFADYLVFLSIYVHIALRYIAEGGSHAIWLLAIAAGISHAVQSMVADYYRDGYLYFAARKPHGKMDSAHEARGAYEEISWRETSKKLAMRAYLNYVQPQDALVPKLRQLHKSFHGGVPEWLTREYRQSCRPLLKWGRLLATNSRMFLLFMFLLLARPHWFFWSEITLFNFVLIFLLLRHEGIYGRLLSMGPQNGAATLRRGMS